MMANMPALALGLALTLPLGAILLAGARALERSAGSRPDRVWSAALALCLLPVLVALLAPGLASLSPVALHLPAPGEPQAWGAELPQGGASGAPAAAISWGLALFIVWSAGALRRGSAGTARLVQPWGAPAPIAARVRDCPGDGQVTFAESGYRHGIVCAHGPRGHRAIPCGSVDTLSCLA